MAEAFVRNDAVRKYPRFSRAKISTKRRENKFFAKVYEGLRTFAKTAKNSEIENVHFVHFVHVHLAANLLKVSYIIIIIIIIIII